jgi:HAD superfamily phosphoserine phosphatase-like hydrolase
MTQLRSASPPAKIKLVAFDVDGTLLRGPTICDCIAAGIGKQEEMQAIERGLTSTVDIAAARARMVCWYRSHDRATLLRHVQTAAVLAAGAREGVANLKRAGIQVALVSITWQFAVEWLASELGADWAVGTQWCANDEIVHFWPADKATWLAGRAAEIGLHPTEIAAVGDSVGDLPMLKYAGRGYFVGADPVDLPSHVQHWPAADISDIVRDLLAAADISS